jgi:hypothetical protein
MDRPKTPDHKSGSLGVENMPIAPNTIKVRIIKYRV